MNTSYSTQSRAVACSQTVVNEEAVGYVDKPSGHYELYWKY